MADFEDIEDVEFFFMEDSGELDMQEVWQAIKQQQDLTLFIF